MQSRTRLWLGSRQPLRHFSATCARYRQSHAAPSRGPLSGLRVVDASRVLAGPFCSQILADYGADVIKIEQPKTGDETRHWKTDAESAHWATPTMSLYFSAVNRNKRSITLNLKKPEAQTIAQRLAATADVFLENFVPGKAESLGLAYDTLAQINPSLIYASLSGYGSSGPFGNRAGYDAIAAAEGGLMHITGHQDGPPVRPGLGMTDMSSGLFLHGAILAALYARAQNPEHKGQHISASLFETQLALLINVGTSNLNTGAEPTRWGAAHPTIVPYNTYQTRDGRWLAIGANNDRQFSTLCRALGRTEWVDDERFQTNARRVENRDDLDKNVADIIASLSLAEWTDKLEGSGLAYGPINTVGEALKHPQALARDMVQEIVCEDWQGSNSEGKLRVIGPAVKFSQTKASIRRRAPHLGEHTTSVLQELGYDDGEVENLRQAGIV